MMNKNKDDSTMVPLFYKDLRYYPTLMAYSQLVTAQERLIWVSIYVVFFAFLFAFSYKKDKGISFGLMGGCLSGVLLFAFDLSEIACSCFYNFGFFP